MLLFFLLLALLFRPALAFFDTIRKLVSTLTKHVHQTHIIFLLLFLFVFIMHWPCVGESVYLLLFALLVRNTYVCMRVANRALRFVAASVCMQLATLSTDKGESKHLK